MKKQILRLSLGMAWCLSALVSVHAPAAGASATADHAARRDTRTAAAQTRPTPADTLHVVFFTDIHVSPGNAQDSLFRVAIAEANASDAELVIFGGDLTNTGSDEELEHVYGLMSQLENRGSPSWATTKRPGLRADARRSAAYSAMTGASRTVREATFSWATTAGPT